MQSLQDHTDIELVRLLSQDSEQAFTVLYHRYWDKLLSVAANRLYSVEEAEEIVQEVFLNLWRRRQQLDLQIVLNSYLATAVKYEVLNRLARRRLFASYETYIQSSTTSSDQSTQDWLAFDELKGLIEQTVKSLPEKCQLVYRLSKEQALSEKSIAQEMNISVKTVESHLSKAMKRLRAALRDARYFFSSF